MKRLLRELKALTKAAQGVIDYMETMHPGECKEDLFVELEEAVASAKVAVYAEEMYEGVRRNAERWREKGGR